MDIRIEPWPPERGRKLILVDGVKWGSVHMESHGAHGVTYHFRQDPEGSGYIRAKNTRFDVPHAVRLQSKRYRDADASTLEAALLQTVRELIEEGRMRDPAILRVEQQERASAMREAEEGRKQNEQRDYEARRGGPARGRAGPDGGRTHS
jgi:hypothetical protein